MEILQRRGKTLDSQVESLKAMMADLDVEAKFFSSTAAEAKVDDVFFSIVFIHGCIILRVLCT